MSNLNRLKKPMRINDLSATELQYVLQIIEATRLIHEQTGWGKVIVEIHDQRLYEIMITITKRPGNDR
jgi:hypothetical protein